MRPIRINPYGPSDSVTSLIAALRERGANVKRLKYEGSTYRGSNNHLILNWGCHSRRSVDTQFHMINDPFAVQIASDKIKTFQKLKESGMENNIPKFTTDQREAQEWAASGITVYCRTLIRASQGRGIVVANTVDEVVDAPLYTGKCPRRREVRIHVFNSEIISFAQKKKMSEERLAEDGITYSNDVRSHGNGWVFAREGVSIPDEEKQVAIAAVGALGLMFGAVDAALSANSVKIFEINTAPGLEGATLEAYVEAVIRAANE